MAKLFSSVLFVTPIAWASCAVAAQMSAPSIISALPDVRSISPANAAGVLQYCVKNHLVSSTAVDPLLTPLTAKHAITGSHDFSTGQAGQIMTGAKSFSLAQASPNLKSQACDMVFRQAKHFK